MVTTEDYLRFGVTGKGFDAVRAGANGHIVVNLSRQLREARKDRGAAWLRNAMIALGFLAVTSAVVSFTAQYLFTELPEVFSQFRGRVCGCTPRVRRHGWTRGAAAGPGVAGRPGCGIAAGDELGVGAVSAGRTGRGRC